MKTREVILVVAGGIFGYFLYGYMNKKRGTTEEVVATETTTEVVVDQAKIDACNKQVDDFMATARFSAGADLDAIRKQKFDECMASK